MASTYRPWQYANRQVVRQRKVRDFRNNAAVYEENAPPAAPSPVQQAASALDETAAPKKKGGGGLFGKLKDVGGDIIEGAKDVGEIALSGEKLQDALGINTEYMDWLRSKGLVGKAAAYALDTATSPLTIATVGAGGWVGAGLRGATAGTKLATAGRVGAALAEPALSGNVARRAIAEVGAGVGAGLASEYAGDALEGAPRPVRTLGALAAGVAGGAAGLNAGRIARNAPEVTARVAAKTGLVPEGAVPFGAMVKADGPMADEYIDVLVRHGVDPVIDEHGFIRADPAELYDLADKVKGTVDEPLVNDILSASVENTRVPGSTAWGGREVQRLEPERQPRSKAEKAGRDAAWAFVEQHKGNTLDDARRAIEDELEAVQNKWFSPEMAPKTGPANNQSISIVDKYGNRRFRDRRASDPRASRVVKVRASMENWSEESVKKEVGAEEWWRVDELQRIQRQLDEMASATFAQPETVKRADLFGNVEDTHQTEAELNGFRAGQGALLPEGSVATKPPEVPENQANFLDQAANEPARPMVEPSGTPAAAIPETGPGMEQRPPDAALGEPPRQGGGAPPEPPAKEPPPPAGTGPDRAFGQDEPVDLLGTRPREKVVAEGRAKESRVPAQLMNRVRSALGRLESEDARVTVGSVMGERNRIQNVREHQVAWALLKERAALRGAGMETVRAEDGFVHLMADGRDVGLFEDVVEQVSKAGRAGYASLTPEQQTALGAIGETNRLFNDTIRFHGGKPRIDPDIEGDYFGRRVTGRTYEGETGETIRVEKGQGNAPSRKVGASRTKSRVLESMEELQAKGFDTEDPWVAREAILRGKLLDAEDGYLKKNLKSLRVKKPGSTLGLASVSGHPAFNNMWFEPDVARRIQKGLDTPAKGPLAAVGAVNSVLTPLRASFDLSATWQQGMRLWLSDPKHASEYWWEVAKSITKDDGVYDNLMLKLDQEGPGLQYLLERGLRFTGENTEGEFFFPKGLVEKAGKLGAPGKAINKTFTKSNQQFGRLLNSYRVQMANSQYQRLVASGLEGAELDDAMRQSVDGVNRAFGWTHAKPSTIEQAVLFAPKYTRATIETLKAAITQGGIEGSMARKHMALLLGEGATLVWLLNEARGYETEFDPRDPNFLRIRNVAGLDVSPFGSYATLFKAIAQTAGGDPTGQGLPDPTAIGKFVEGKLSPAVGAGYWPLKGETYLGEPLEPFAGPEGFAKAALEQGKTNLPFGVQNLLGEGPAAAVVGSTGLSASPLSPAEKRDLARSGSPGGINLPGLGNIETTGREKPGLAEKMFGQDYDALPGSQKAQVNEQPAVRKQQEDVDRRALRQGGDRGMAAQVRQQVEAELEASAQYLAQGTSADGKRYTGNDFRKAYHDTMLRAAGARKLIKDYGTDPELDGWFALYEQATMPNGQTDYDRLERAQAEYRVAHPDIDEKVDKITGIRDNAAVRELREAKKLAKAYYEIPGYRGMTVDEAEKAGEFLSLANDLVAHGKARNRRHALVLLREYDEEGAKLAMKAARVGANPERKKFRVANPTFGKYYSDAGLVTE